MSEVLALVPSGCGCLHVMMVLMLLGQQVGIWDRWFMVRKEGLTARILTIGVGIVSWRRHLRRSMVVVMHGMWRHAVAPRIISMMSIRRSLGIHWMAVVRTWCLLHHHVLVLVLLLRLRVEVLARSLVALILL